MRTPSRNVAIINVPVGAASSWSSWFLLSADRHHDNPHNNWGLEERHLKQARKRGAGIIDCGDLFCAMQGRDDRRGSKGSIKRENCVDDYIDSIIDSAVRDYKPYADLFRVIGRGNHETAILKRLETDIASRFVKDLNREAGTKIQAGGYGGWVVFRFRKSAKTIGTIRLKYFHGTGGGGRATKGVRAVTHRSAQWPDADIILGGHIHEQWLVETVRERLGTNGKPYLSPQTHVCTATYKEEYGDGFDGWHVERDAPPKPLGAWWLRFMRDNRTNQIIYELSQAK